MTCRTRPGWVPAACTSRVACPGDDQDSAPVALTRTSPTPETIPMPQPPGGWDALRAA
ncbi:hypothetical protein GCM10022263_08950 [Nocardioides daeguensis]|uniref:Uncharacterized protein n=1 Tax=Nocardioides daeguensis TaxID=908359 RepID=A0ABP6UUM2_9ACTN